MDPKRLGAWGETKAMVFLERKGYRICERNYCCKAGEIDLIARDGSVWVFVEVKTRRHTGYGLPCEAVTKRKQLHIRNAVLQYIATHGLQNEAMRIDIVEVLLKGEKVWVRHIMNAF